jgi:hypothetical protein
MKFSNYFLGGILALCVFAIGGCKKSPEYVPEPYRCDCGTLNWFGSPYDMYNTSFILTDSTQIASRRYYVTAKISAANEALVQEVNLILEADDITLGILAKDSINSEFSGIAQSVGVNNSFAISYPYRVTEGTLSVSPALLGGTETVNFNVKLDPLFGNASDPLVPASGSFTVQVPY